MMAARSFLWCWGEGRGGWGKGWLEEESTCKTGA
jgi:hypothetical protein